MRALTRRLPSREVVITLGLFVVLMAVVLSLGVPEETERPFDLNSNGKTGLLALRLWLTELGYTVGDTGERQFDLPSDADLVFVYPSLTPYTTAEATALLKWVGRGHTLVIIGPDARDTVLIRLFGVRPRFAISEIGASVWQRQPLLPLASANLGQFQAETSLSLFEVGKAMPVLGTDDGHTTLAVQAIDQGVVWYLSPQHPLTNDYLKDGEQAQIVLALLRTVPAGRRVVFDTYHMRPRSQTTPTLYDWFYGTPVGWATLFASALVVVYLFLQGIRLGRPLPSQGEGRLREAAEYVMAVAALQRRARHSQAVAGYHKRRLKLGLGHTLHLSPEMGDTEFMARLTQDGRLDTSTLANVRDLLIQLSRDPQDAELVKLVARVDAVLGHTRPR